MQYLILKIIVFEKGSQNYARKVVYNLSMI